jgi:hypothetical protein
MKNPILCIFVFSRNTGSHIAYRVTQEMITPIIIQEKIIFIITRLLQG